MANEKRLDLIDRKALAERYVELDYNTAGTPWTLRDVLNFLELAPTVDAKPVVHGRWRLETDEEEPNGFFKLLVCTACSKTGNGGNYCPNCGARMDGDGK